MRLQRAPRLLVPLVAAALLAAGCGGGSKSTSSAGAAGSASAAASAKKGPKAGVVYDIGGRGDKSFNDSAAAGLDKAKSELGATVKELSPNTGGTDREENLRLLADQGFNPIIAVGFLFEDSVKKVAAAYPNLTFAIVDDVVDLPNVRSLTFAEEQGSYLVGAAAALKSTTGNLGFIGGVDTPLLRKFQAGYQAGAKAVKPDIKIQSKYLTQPPDFTGFGAPDKGRETARGMYDGGADVIYAAAGGSGAGVFQAAKDGSTGGKTFRVVGVDADQYQSAPDPVKSVIMTSMVKRVDVAVFQFVKDFAGGNTKGGNTVFDLKADGVGYATSGNFISDIQPKIEDYKQQIIAGKITVPSTV